MSLAQAAIGGAAGDAPDVYALEDPVKTDFLGLVGIDVDAQREVFVWEPRASERVLVRELLFVMQSIDGAHLKWDAARDFLDDMMRKGRSSFSAPMATALKLEPAAAAAPTDGSLAAPAVVLVRSPCEVRAVALRPLVLRRHAVPRAPGEQAARRQAGARAALGRRAHRQAQLEARKEPARAAGGTWGSARSG